MDSHGDCRVSHADEGIQRGHTSIAIDDWLYHPFGISTDFDQSKPLYQFQLVSKQYRLYRKGFKSSCAYRQW